MSLVKTPEDEFVHELEGYLDIKFDKYSLNKVNGFMAKYKATVIDQNPNVIIQEKVVYRQLKTHEIPPPEILIVEPYQILSKICDATGLSVKQITGRNRKAELVLARHVAMYVIRDVSGQTLSSIARMFNRDHTTVIYAISHVINMIEVGSPQYTKLIGYVNFHLSHEAKKSA